MKKLLVANRGEIAIRIMHAAAELGVATVAVWSEDDAAALHRSRADAARALPGRGVAAYLDGAALIAAAEAEVCDAVHPGYGFLSENADFARACEAAGLTFVGPSAETLDLFGDKAAARALAARVGAPLLDGTDGPTSLDAARAFFDALPEGAGMMVKALAGGGGRGIRAVTRADEVEAAWTACRSEAERAFGRADVYVERFLPRARHVEVQVAGDAGGAVAHLWERECSLQRRNQKIVEIAPAPGLAPDIRARLLDAAVTLAKAAGLRNLATVEFLVDAETGEAAFIETNARLQVEHTVTEAVTGLDLVRLQLELASGRSLRDLGLADGAPAPRGIAMQVRVNMETLDAEGLTRPSGGTIAAFEIPFGPGVRVDTCGYAGLRASPAFDSLLAKVICHAASGSLDDVTARARRALSEFRIEGVETNIGFLHALLSRADLTPEALHTRYVDARMAELAEAAAGPARRRFPVADEAPRARAQSRNAGADPLGVLDFGRAAREQSLNGAGEAAGGPAPAGDLIPAPMQGTVVELCLAPGAPVAAGARIAVLEAMKMQHDIAAPASGVLRGFAVAAGDMVFEGDPLAWLDAGDGPEAEAATREVIDLDRVRPDLAELHDRRALLCDDARPDAVARRRRLGQRTARENVTDLVDDGAFVEYGGFAIASQRTRRDLDDLIRNTPADGLITGVGAVNGALVGAARAQTAILHYDYTVLAGTQGKRNHDKTDRLLEIAARQRLPVVFFTEGGGGRPGDVDVPSVGGLHVMAFHLMAKLSGLVPMVGVNSGRCFAGNASLLGMCDVIIATRNSSIGMGGPAMIEGGGLGVFSPEEVGPMAVQVPNGVVDIAVEDEAEAVAVAKKYLSYFQGPLADWTCADQRRLRQIVPENRLKVYDIREVIETMADADSVLELRRAYGPGMVTALIRIEGRPMGVVANNPVHLAGAIDTPGADKAARFLQLCDAHDLPILFLCDTPGMMVGPEVEKTALVRHCSRLFVTGANLTVPFFTMVLRKSYGLGAQAMAGGSFRAPLFSVAWPTGEFGGMGLEGAVKLGFRKELEAIADPAARKAKFDEMVAAAYARGKALSTATYFEIDDVIDPAESRDRIGAALRASPPPAPRTGKKRPNIDAW